MPENIRKIIIVGGGTAGWITAGVLANRYQDVQAEYEIQLLESPDIKTVGVGEGTWPSMRSTLQSIGIREVDFIKQCDVSLKQGSKFVSWKNVGEDYYYHPFSLPISFSEFNLAEYWQPFSGNIKFAEAVSAQPMACDAKLAPKQAGMPDYAFAFNYAYHLDAGKFADFLAKHCVDELGVKHVLGNLQSAKTDEQGFISHLQLESGESIEGDFFIDCTGFRARLLHDCYGIEMQSVTNVLFNNSAVVTQVPYDNEQNEIESCTLSTAQSAGWIWDIGLPTRRGVGYVYSDQHLSDSEAESKLREYVAATTSADITTRKLSFEPGYRKKFWHKNCVAIGLSAGFVEPLEASAIVLIETSAKYLAQHLPSQGRYIEPVSNKFNIVMHRHWQQIIEFLKLHYVLSSRDDSEYWLQHRGDSVSADLRDKLELWSSICPWHDDVPWVDSLFPAASYQYVLYGMGHKTNFEAKYKKKKDLDKARELFRENALRAQEHSSALASNRAFLQQLQA